MSADVETAARRCRLHHAAGRMEPCTGEGCPFWEPGGAVVGARCALEELDLEGRPELVPRLLELRATLESAQASEAAGAWRRFYRLRGGEG